MVQVTGKYDTVTCIDVMIHYPTEKMAEMVTHLASLSNERIFVSFAPKVRSCPGSFCRVRELLLPLQELPRPAFPTLSTCSAHPLMARRCRSHGPKSSFFGAHLCLRSQRQTPQYVLLKKIGELFPGPSKTTRAYLHPEEDVRAALEKVPCAHRRTRDP